MSLLKKQEGGDNPEQEDPTLGKGNPMDTLTEDVQKHKNNFLSAVKTKATTVKTEEMYDKLRKSNDPSMQQLAMGQQFQVGGMTGGQDHCLDFLVVVIKDFKKILITMKQTFYLKQLMDILQET
jgi:hypothetical protein